MPKVIAPYQEGIIRIHNYTYVEEVRFIGSLDQCRKYAHEQNSWPCAIYDRHYIEVSEGDQKLLWLHRMHDRVAALEDLTGSGESIVDWYFNGYDEVARYDYYYPSDLEEELNLAVNDLKEYNHMVEAITSVDTDAILSELISEQVLAYAS